MLESLSFDNRFVRELPADANRENTRRAVHGACYSHVLPTPVSAPRLLAYSKEMAARLGLSADDCNSPEFAQVFAGNRLLSGMEPYAACYGGHQFGSWAGQLGDGRAISLGEVVNLSGERWELQLKGAGPTPYSRSGDGRAVLRSSMREFLCSEAMYHLGIPTTRALCLVATGESVLRDMFYDGRAQNEPGAIVCRAAPSFVRFGNFELLARRNDLELLRNLVDFTIRRDFPELGEPNPEVYLRWFTSVAERTAQLIVHFMRVGFVHGVMNTDNMSILGLTIDYGPYGWLDHFDPAFTPNTSDAQGRRYRFENQPRVALWNLVQLAQALTKLGLKEADLDHAVSAYGATWNSEYPPMMLRKLGLPTQASEAEREEASWLVDELLELLGAVETDMTLFFRALATFPLDQPADLTERQRLSPLLAAYYAEESLPEPYVQRMAGWLRRYTKARTQTHEAPAIQIARMRAENPSLVLRNYLVQQAIEAAEQGDLSKTDELLKALSTPYSIEHEGSPLASRRPEWARNRAGCSMLSCSS